MIEGTGYNVVIGFATEKTAKEEKAWILRERGYVVKIIKMEMEK